MKKSILLIICCLCYVGNLMAQNISGKVVDENQNPLPSVNVVLQTLKDSSFVTGIATASSGQFCIPVEQDTEYILTISYIGYRTVHKACKAGDIGTISLAVDEIMQKEVNVIASRIQRDAKGYTINLKSSDIVKGKQSDEALAFLPGVTKEDAIYKVNGLPVSNIYVDGVKLTDIGELKNIPADMMEKVQVNYLAGSDENASLTGGTISIFLRRPPENGYYGALMAGANLYPSYGFSNENVGGIIYYRHKNLSIYDNLSVNFRQPEETSDQSIWNKSTDLLSKIKEEAKYRGHSITNRISLNQQINSKNSIGASYYIASNRLKTSSSSSTVDDENAIKSAVDNKDNYLDQEATVKYTSMLSQRGTTLEILGDYFNRQSDNHTDYLYNGNTSSESSDESSLNMYKLSVDLTDPRSQKLVWKYGASIQYLTSDYTPDIHTNEADGSNRFPTSLTATRTTGLTPLAYVSAMGQLWKIRYSAGVSWQLNRIEYQTMDDRKKDSDVQWAINPTVQLMMPIDKKGQHALMLNYKHTLDDIPYAAISSTVRWTDSYNYTVGNSALKSPTMDIVMAGVSLFRNKLNLTAVYAHADNTIYWKTIQSESAPDVFYTTPINLRGIDSYGINAELNLNPVKPWTMKLTGRLEIMPEDITLDNIYYGKTRLRQYYTMYNTFAFSGGWGGMLNLMLEPTYRTYDRTYYTVYNVGGNIYKNMCRDKLRLTLNFNIFGDRRKYDRHANGSKITYDFTTPVQNIGISLTWRFSGGKQVNVKAIENGSQSFKEIKDVR